MTHSFPHRQLASTLLFFYGGIAAFAQTWHGTTFPSSNWNDPQNWFGGLPANDGTANVVFALTDSVFDANLTANWNINTLAFSGMRTRPQSLTIFGPATLTIQGGLTQTGSAMFNPFAILGVNMVIPAMQTWSIATVVTASGNISGAGGLTKSGAGILNLGVGNTYTGGTITNAGTLSISDDSSLGSLAGSLQLNGGTVRFAYDPATYPQGATLGRSVLLGNSGGKISTVKDLAISGQITGTGPLIIAQDQAGNGPIITLSGANTFTGGLQLTNYSTNIYGRLLVTCLGTAQSLGNGPVSLSAGTILSIDAQTNVGPSKAIIIGPTSGLVVTNDSFDPGQVISATATQSYLMLTGQPYNRALDQLSIGDGTLFLGGGSAQPVIYAAASLQPGSGNKYRLGSSPIYGGGALVFSGHSNVLTGTASLLVSGQVELHNANNYSGGTLLSGGALGVGDNHAVGSGLVTLNGGSLGALNGPAAIANNLLLTAPSSLTGELIFNGTLDLNGGTTDFGINGTATFNNAIGNGSFSDVGYGTAILNAANTFSALRVLYGTVSISSVANLGGPTTPITLQGDDQRPGTLRATMDISLPNPIFPSTGGLEVDAGATLTITQSIAGGQLYKKGAGTLVLSPAATGPNTFRVMNGMLLSSGNSLSGSFVDILPGGTFAGTGKINSLILDGGSFAPGGGTGIIDSEIVYANNVNVTDLRFGFSVNGSPNYANVASSGNGLLALTDMNSGPLFPLCGNVSIFLSAPSAQLGDTFKGAFYLKANLSLISTLLDGANFRYYALSPTGSTVFNGQNYTLLDPAQFAMTRAWVNETASIGGGPPINGKVLKFTVTAPAAPLLVTNSILPSASLYTSYSTTLVATGAPNPTFTLVGGELPLGIALSSSGIISGQPYSNFGTFKAMIQAGNGIQPSSTKEFQISVTADYYQWALFHSLSGSPTDTPLGDGVPNLLKYLYHIDPRVGLDSNAHGALPLVGSTVESGHRYLTLTYRESLVAKGITVGLEASTDLQSWAAVAPSFRRIVGTDPVTFDPIVQLGLDVTALPTEMIRLRVSLP